MKMAEDGGSAIFKDLSQGATKAVLPALCLASKDFSGALSGVMNVLMLSQCHILILSVLTINCFTFLSFYILPTALLCPQLSMPEHSDSEKEW